MQIGPEKYAVHEQTLANDSTGKAWMGGPYADKTVQVVGEFSGAVAHIEGSMDGVNWAVLTDPGGDPLSFASAGLALIVENPRFIRPRTSDTGNGSTSIKVVLGGSALR